MESVILSPPCQPVDLLISNQTRPWTGHDGVSPAELVRQGGFVLLAEAPAVGTVPADRFEPMDRNGQLLRKLTPPTRNHIAATIPSRAFTLAAHHDQAMLVDRYSNLARSLARRFAGRGERIEDLEQVALLALVKAAGRYDPARERPFGAFATACILGEIKRHFRDKLWMVRVPRSVQETHLAIRAARDELSHVNGKSPTIKQIAEYIGASEEAVLTAMEAVTNTWTRSLDAPGRDDEDPVTDVPVIDQRFEHALDHRVLKESVSQLSPTERLILKRVFFDECTQRQVADELGVSQMQISRIITKTLNKMRETFQPA